MRPGTRRTAPSGRKAALTLLVLGALAPGPGAAEAEAQVLEAVLGAGGGVAVGLYTTTAIYVTEARFGRYIYSVDDVATARVENLPMVLGPVAGTWLGLESGHALGRAGLWGGAGFLGGAAVGLGAGHMLWGDREGRWAGAIIGSAVGLLTGAVLGARDGLSDDDQNEGRAVTFALSIPVGGGPR